MDVHMSLIHDTAIIYENILVSLTFSFLSHQDLLIAFFPTLPLM